MRVLVINNRPPYGGIWKHSTTLYGSLKDKMGDNVDWLQWNGGFIEDFYRRFGHNIFLESVEEVMRIGSHFKFLYTIPRGYDVYHITNNAMALACRWRKPIVVTVHDMIPFADSRGWSDRFLKKSMEDTVKADEVICVSEYTKNEMLRFLDIDKEHIHVIPNSVELEIFKPANKEESRSVTNLPKDSTIVLHVGNEEPRKDIPTLLRSFALFKKDNPDAILVRIGEQFPETKRLIGELSINESVKYYSGVKNVQDYYTSADMFVLPSTYEGFGIPALEAMASGCPVIVADASSLPEVVGDCGLLFEPGNYEMLAIQMGKILKRGRKIKKGVAAGIERSRLFSPERVADDTIKVYRKTLRYKKLDLVQ